MINKEKVIAATIAAFERRLEERIGSVEDARKMAQDAPGSNVSHSDTYKFQYSNLALGREAQVVECRDTIAYLRNLATTPSQKVVAGSVFTLFNIDTESSRTYLVLEKGGGEEVVVDNVHIMTISVAAPIARAALHKIVGDEVGFRKDTFEITEVY